MLLGNQQTATTTSSEEQDSMTTYVLLLVQDELCVAFHVYMYNNRTTFKRTDILRRLMFYILRYIDLETGAKKIKSENNCDTIEERILLLLNPVFSCPRSIQSILRDNSAQTIEPVAILR